MTANLELQPDQQPARWDHHVGVYEAVFEPLTNAFARAALDRLNLRPGEKLIDIGAGSGGTALIAATEHGADVLAVDASPEMVARINARARQLPDSTLRVRADVMDGMALSLPAAGFDAAISVFGVILFPDAVGGMREIARVLKPGGRVAIVTWTDTDRYELATRLVSAIVSVRGPQPPPSTLPAQLRFREATAFHRLMSVGGLRVESIVRVQEQWRLPSARWIADRIAFAPGLSALVAGLGPDCSAVMAAFIDALEREQGRDEVSLSAVAQIGIATKPLITNE